MLFHSSPRLSGYSRRMQLVGRVGLRRRGLRLRRAAHCHLVVRFKPLRRRLLKRRILRSGVRTGDSLCRSG